MGSAVKFLLATKELRGRLVFEIVRVVFPNKLKSTSEAFQSHIAPRPGTGIERTPKLLSQPKIKQKNSRFKAAIKTSISIKIYHN